MTKKSALLLLLLLLLLLFYYYYFIIIIIIIIIITLSWAFSNNINLPKYAMQTGSPLKEPKELSTRK